MKIFLHIGASRTGTTSFQNICRKNHEKLNQMGVAYPLVALLDPKRGVAQHNLAFSLLKPYPEFVAVEGRMSKEEAWDQLHNFLKKCSNDKKVLLSSEAFSSLDSSGVEYVAQQLKSYDVEVIYVKRNQDEWARSMYEQNIKTRRFHTKPFEPGKNKGRDVTKDHIQFWEKNHNITILSYRPDTSETIFSLIGIDYSKLEIPDRKNEKLPEFVVDILLDLNKIDMSILQHKKLNNLVMSEFQQSSPLVLSPTLLNLLIAHHGLNKVDTLSLSKNSPHEFFVAVRAVQEIDLLDFDHATKSQICKAIFTNIPVTKNKVKRRANNSSQKYDSLKTEFDKLKATQSKSAAQLQKTLDSQNLRNKENQNLISTLEMEISKLEAKRKREVEAQASHAHSLEDQIGQQKQSTAARIAKFEKTIKTYKSQDKRRNKQLKALEKKLEDQLRCAEEAKEEANAKLKETIDAYNAQDGQKNEQIKVLETKLEKTMKSAEEAEEEANAKLKKTVDAHTAQDEQKDERIKVIETKLEKTMKSAEEAEEEANAKLKKTVDAYNAQDGQKNERIKVLETKLEKTMKSADEAEAAASAKLKKTVDANNAQIVQKNERIKVLETKLEKTMKSADEAEAAASAKLKKTVGAYNAQDGQKNARIKVLISQKEKSEEILVTTKKQYEAKERQYQKTIKKMEHSYKDLSNELASIESANEILEAEIEEIRQTKLWKLNQKIRGPKA